MNRIKQLMAGVLVAVTTSLFSLPLVSADSVARNQPWDLTGSYVINFDQTSGSGTGVPHLVNITTFNGASGVFAGSGYYTVNPSYTWTVSGQLSGSAVAMRILYTGQNANYFVNLNGSINPDGSMLGTAVDSSNSTFNWNTISGHATYYANHGTYVSSQTDKQAAAQSTVGMPLPH